MSLANFTIICDHNITCPTGCHLHCGRMWSALKSSQAHMIKHVHMADNERHEVRILNDGRLEKHD